MQVSVTFDDEHLDFELPEECVVASWRAPAGLNGSQQLAAIRDALDQPWDFPPLRQMLVPGDRVVVAFDSTIAERRPLMESLGRIMQESGIEPENVTVLAPSAGCGLLGRAVPEGAALVVHDPGDRSNLAYLATTKKGRRIYMNRLLTDADVVIPVGRLGYHPILGYRGPWSVLFPDLSDRETIEALRLQLRGQTTEPAPERARASLDESFEVSWLLGSQFQVGVVPGARGLVAVVAGRENSVREHGISSLDRHWKLDATSRAELVVVGIGRSGVRATIDDLAEGLATACRLVQHGGKIVALSRASGSVGPSLRRLVETDDLKARAAAFRGHEADDDFLVARRFMQAQAWADVFVLSGLASEIIEDLSLIALENPEQARRLVGKSGSCSFVSQAELTRAGVMEEDESG
jgi:hypothetical protein